MDVSVRVEPPWTKERLEAWAKERAQGIQYMTKYGPVFCPPRDWKE